MATIHRMERSHGNFTVMGNIHLQDRSLSLKAKGLLSLMLSLPEDWRYSITGLAAICNDGKDSVRTAVRELERAGYICRRREKDAHGRLRTRYEILEDPALQAQAQPLAPQQASLQPAGLQSADLQPAGTPPAENPTQYSIKEQSIQKANIQPSIYPAGKMEDGMDGTDAICLYGYAGRQEENRLRRELRRNMGVEALGEEYGRGRMEELVELALGVLLSRKRVMHIAGGEYPAGFVKGRLRRVNSLHVQYIMEQMEGRGEEVKNPRAYLLAALFNAPATMEQHYKAV